MSSYLKTYTGLKVEALNPEASSIELRDIAHALSLNCRGNGQVTHFYSVAQHCINAYYEAKVQNFSTRVQLYCILHDAAEAYITDLIRPVKQYLPKYQEIEAKFLDAIFEHFRIGQPSDEEWSKVKFIDDALLDYDLFYLLKEDKPLEGFKTKRIPELDFKDPYLVEEEYYNVTISLLKELDLF